MHEILGIDFDLCSDDDSPLCSGTNSKQNVYILVNSTDSTHRPWEGAIRSSRNPVLPLHLIQDVCSVLKMIVPSLGTELCGQNGYDSTFSLINSHSLPPYLFSRDGEVRALANLQKFVEILPRDSRVDHVQSNNIGISSLEWADGLFSLGFAEESMQERFVTVAAVGTRHSPHAFPSSIFLTPSSNSSDQPQEFVETSTELYSSSLNETMVSLTQKVRTFRERLMRSLERIGHNDLLNHITLSSQHISIRRVECFRDEKSNEAKIAGNACFTVNVVETGRFAESVTDRGLVHILRSIFYREGTAQVREAGLHLALFQTQDYAENAPEKAHRPVCTTHSLRSDSTPDLSGSSFLPSAMGLVLGAICQTFRVRGLESEDNGSVPSKMVDSWATRITQHRYPLAYAWKTMRLQLGSENVAPPLGKESPSYSTSLSTFRTLLHETFEAKLARAISGIGLLRRAEYSIDIVPASKILHNSLRELYSETSEILECKLQLTQVAPPDIFIDPDELELFMGQAKKQLNNSGKDEKMFMKPINYSKKDVFEETKARNPVRGMLSVQTFSNVDVELPHEMSKAQIFLLQAPNTFLYNVSQQTFISAESIEISESATEHNEDLPFGSYEIAYSQQNQGSENSHVINNAISLHFKFALPIHIRYKTPGCWRVLSDQECPATGTMNEDAPGHNCTVPGRQNGIERFTQDCYSSVHFPIPQVSLACNAHHHRNSGEGDNVNAQNSGESAPFQSFFPIPVQYVAAVPLVQPTTKDKGELRPSRRQLGVNEMESLSPVAVADINYRWLVQLVTRVFTTTGTIFIVYLAYSKTSTMQNK